MPVQATIRNVFYDVMEDGWQAEITRYLKHRTCLQELGHIGVSFCKKLILYVLLDFPLISGADICSKETQQNSSCLSR